MPIHTGSLRWSQLAARIMASDAVLARRTHGRIDGLDLPPLAIRMGGANFASDTDFLAGGDRDLHRLEDQAGLGPASRVLDFGCGPGRLAIAIARKYGCIDRYVGVEVQEKHVRWCRRHLPECYQFVFSDASNSRYNPSGKLGPGIPVEPDFTIIYAYSVFSHMLTADVRAYLHEFHRLLANGGTAWFTCFVETDVEQEVENPTDYVYYPDSGPLHVVRFEVGHFNRLLSETGFEIEQFEQGSDTNGQSLYVVRKAKELSAG